MTLYLTVTVPSPRANPTLWSFGCVTLLGVFTWLLYVIYGWPDWVGAAGFVTALATISQSGSSFLLAQDWADRGFTECPSPTSTPSLSTSSITS